MRTTHVRQHDRHQNCNCTPTERRDTIKAMLKDEAQATKEYSALSKKAGTHTRLGRKLKSISKQEHQHHQFWKKQSETKP